MYYLFLFGFYGRYEKVGMIYKGKGNKYVCEEIYERILSTEYMVSGNIYSCLNRNIRDKWNQLNKGCVKCKYDVFYLRSVLDRWVKNIIFSEFIILKI